MARLGMENLARKDDPILVLNSGSSSLKFGIYYRGSGGDGDEEPLLTGSAEGIGQNNGTFQIRFSDGNPARRAERRPRIANRCPFRSRSRQSGIRFTQLQWP